MKRKKSSKRWLKEHFQDSYVKKAQTEGYRSRAVYKLKEIDTKEDLIRPGMVVVDLGAAPGGWSQYVTQKLKGNGQVIALDILPMDALTDVDFIQSDFQEDEALQALLAIIPGSGVDLILSDMAPNLSGTQAIDMPKIAYLVECVFDFADKILKPDGSLFVKLFHGEGFDALVSWAKSSFKRVVVKKPAASRARSRETYLLARGYNG